MQSIMQTEIIFGSDYELIRAKVRNLLQKMGKTQAETEKINFEENDFSAIIKKLTVRSFWEETVLIVEHLEIYRKWGKKQRERLEHAINHNKLAKILVWYQKTKVAIDNWPFEGQIHELKTFTTFQKKQKIAKFLTDAKVIGTSKALIEAISRRLPNNIEIIERNLEKIKYYGESSLEPLKIDDLDLVLDQSANSNLFVIIEGLILKKPAIVLQNQIKQLTTANKNILLWLKLLTLYSKTIIEIKVDFPKNSLLKIAQKLKKNPVFIRKMASFIHLVELKWLEQIMATVQEWEFKFRKWGWEKNDMIKLLIIELYEKANANES